MSGTDLLEFPSRVSRVADYTITKSLFIHMNYICNVLPYRFATIPLMYPASFVFRVPSVAFVLLACANLFIGIITTITVVVLENFDDEELQYIGNILKDVFLIFPQYCLGRGLMELAAEYNKNLIAGRFGLESTRSNRFEFDFTGN